MRKYDMSLLPRDPLVPLSGVSVQIPGPIDVHGFTSLHGAGASPETASSGSSGPASAPDGPAE